MKVLHIVPGLNDITNGMAVVVRFFAKEQGEAEVMDLNCAMQEFGVLEQKLKDCVEEVWVHGMWLPKEWTICWRVLRAGKRLVRMTHGSLSPVYLKQQGRWKKWLVGPIERYFLRRCEKIVATCEAEKIWIEAYLGKKCPQVEIVDLKSFFDFSRVERVEGDESVFNAEAQRRRGAEKDELHLLYLGRRHPWKGVEYLEKAVKELGVRSQGLGVRDVENNSKLELQNLELKIVSNAFGEELEKVWEWCDVLVLPTLSENFGLVIAEALERGKRVITTDGAPVWGEESDGVEEWVSGGVESRYEGRLLYLKGYREGSDEERVRLLKDALMMV